MLTYLILSHNNDQPIDFLDDDEYVCLFDPSNDEITESLDDAINASYKQIWQ